MTYLLDTNVISELRRRDGDATVKRWIAERRSADLFLSVITVLEIEVGILNLERRDPRQASLLQRWLEGPVLAGFAGRILPIDVAVVRRVAPLHVPDRAPGHDALIAGTALAHALTVVTRNVADVAGVPCVDPWVEGSAGPV